MITIDQMVQREVLCCMSSLVSTLAGGYGDLGDLNKDFRDLAEQAYELAAPVLDYEEAARQEGWGKDTVPTIPNPEGYWMHPEHWHPAGNPVTYESAQECCEAESLDPYEWEVYEHWAVSQWLAEKLIAQSERVDTDFAGLNIWARTTTGQAISMDGCMRRIYQEMVK